MNALTVIETSNAELYRASTDAASLCKQIVVATAKNIQGRNYVCVEGWQAIAVAHGCTASARGVEVIDGGVRAIGEIRRMSDGAVIAEAEGFVGEDEPTWFGGKAGNRTLPKRADYAIRAMAQTRAISRACRSAFAHVVVMMNAGLSTTPAEEVPYGGFDDAPPARDMGSTNGPRPARAAAERAAEPDPRRAVAERIKKAIAVADQAELTAIGDREADAYHAMPDELQAELDAAFAARGKELRAKPAAQSSGDDILDDTVPY